MLDKYFGNVCELDLMFSIDVSHHILDEMVMNGHIVETNRCAVGVLFSCVLRLTCFCRANVLKPVRAFFCQRH